MQPRRCSRRAHKRTYNPPCPTSSFHNLADKLQLPYFPLAINIRRNLDDRIIMKNFWNLETFSTGLAMFAMFFGAGNVIFPLGIGQYAGDQNAIATLGLLITAVLMPFMGVFAMILFEGNYRQFFSRIGKIPGFILALTTITLLGPIGSTPRCIALTYSTLKSSFPDISLTIFSACACVIIYLFSMQKNRILGILGYVLTPLLILSLASIVLIGFWHPSEVQVNDASALSMFLHGLKEGYNTMDLLAAFFFSSTILAILKSRQMENNESGNGYIRLALRASLLGGLLLSLVYVGFSSISAFHGSGLDTINKDELLNAITMKIAGPYANLLICLTVTLACLTTAIALISVFSDFVQKEVFQEKVSYKMTLAGALLITFAISTLEFSGISAFLGPVLQVCYPGLIVLTLLNIAYKLVGFAPVKVPVFLAFAVAAYFHFA